MNNEYAQRRRVAIAAAITAIAVPSVFLLSNTGDSSGSDTIVVGVGTVPGASIAGAQQPAASPDAPDETNPSATDAMGTVPPAFLDGTAPTNADDPATIAIPRLGTAIDGIASFKSSINDTTLCQVTADGVPFNSTVTVTNLDNSRSIQCVASIPPPAADDGIHQYDIVLNDDAFLRIADLTDAPVPVEISW